MSKLLFRPALPHSALREIFPNIFFVSGTSVVPGPLPFRFSRNMIIVREDERLIILNSMRLTTEGERALDELGQVRDVIRLAGFHGADDAYYKHRYQAKIWAIRGQRYVKGFRNSAPSYFEPDAFLDASSTLPLRDARLHMFETTPPEAICLLQRDGGIAITGDSLQNWETTDEFFNWPSKILMKAMGFIKPHNVGPGWLKQTKPSQRDLRALLELSFQHVLPAHGAPVIGHAKEAFTPAIQKAIAIASH